MFEIITLPFDAGKRGFDAEPLNRFLLNKRLRQSRAEFFEDGGTQYWSVLVEYEPLPDKTPPPKAEDLDDAGQLLLERLREWRKLTAEKQGVPAYVVANNRELIEVARRAPESLEQLKGIRGYGSAKVKRFGEDIVKIVAAFKAG